MAMTPEEREAFRIADLAEVEAMFDRSFLKAFGRTFRGDENDLRLAKELEAAKPAPKTDEGSPPQADSLSKIEQDFPGLFGKGGDAT